ncbi:MAG: hypothetical protein H6Q68_3586 [Firmicutes bacterium]|nr:hypothetical protein [Bacillota bacterium]
MGQTIVPLSSRRRLSFSPYGSVGRYEQFRIFLGESLSLEQSLGALLVMLGLAVHVFRRY